MAGWRQGEHVCIVGSTNSGKTYLENLLLKRRGYVIFFRTKAENPKRDPMDRTWKRVKSVAEVSTLYRYWLVDPPYERQHTEGVALMRKAREEGNWTIAIDELYACTLKHINIEEPINWGLTQGRSQGITMVCGMQRPSHVTRFALSEAHHSFIFAVSGRDATEILAKEITPGLKDALPRLDFRRHQFAYYNRGERRLLISDASQIGRFM